MCLAHVDANPLHLLPAQPAMQAEPAQHADEAEPGLRRTRRKSKSVERFDPPSWQSLGGAAAATAAAKPSEAACDEDSDSDEEDDMEPCARSAPAVLTCMNRALQSISSGGLLRGPRLSHNCETSSFAATLVA